MVGHMNTVDGRIESSARPDYFCTGRSTSQENIVDPSRFSVIYRAEPIQQILIIQARIDKFRGVRSVLIRNNFSPPISIVAACANSDSSKCTVMRSP